MFIADTQTSVKRFMNPFSIDVWGGMECMKICPLLSQALPSPCQCAQESSRKKSHQVPIYYATAVESDTLLGALVIGGCVLDDQAFLIWLPSGVCACWYFMMFYDVVVMCLTSILFLCEGWRWRWTRWTSATH